MGQLFGTDGIRGQANRHPITPEIALQVGKGIAQVFHASGHGDRRAIIGKDTRLSGYMLETALTSGLVSMGMDVFLVGPMPTPAVALLTRSITASVGIMLTASHNPYDDNGIKVFDHEGFKLSDEIEAQVERLVTSNEMSSEHIRSDSLGKAFRIDDARGRYIEFAKGTIRNHSLEGLKVVLDCANGATYQIAPWIFRELGAKVIKAFNEPDGYNINNACGATHPETVAVMVREHRADVGIAFDGDGDRVIFADNQGRIVDGDRIIAACAIGLKNKGQLRNDTIAVTSMSNMGLHEAMKAHGIGIEVTDVGDRHVIERMRKQDLNLGGEKSGHVVFMDYITTGDGIITALQLLRLMQEQGTTLSELADCMEEYPQRLVALKIAQKKPLDALPHVQETLTAAHEALDGVGRALLRYSGTEPKIRVLVEARETDQVDEWTDRLVAAVRKDLG